MADFNGDGRLDLAYRRYDEDSLIYLALDNAEGEYVPGTPFEALEARGLTALDVDHDGGGT